MFCPDFAFLGRTDRPGGMKQLPGKSAQCLKPTRRIWRADANFLLAKEPEMCYNIPAKTSTATETPERQDSTMYPAVIMILRSVGLLMQMRLICLEQMAILLALTFSRTVEIILYQGKIPVAAFG